MVGENANIVDGSEAEKSISMIGVLTGATAGNSVDGTTWCTAPMRTETMENLVDGVLACITYVQGNYRGKGLGLL